MSQSKAALVELEALVREMRRQEEALDLCVRRRDEPGWEEAASRHAHAVRLLSEHVWRLGDKLHSTAVDVDCDLHTRLWRRNATPEQLEEDRLLGEDFERQLEAEKLRWNPRRGLRLVAEEEDAWPTN